MRLGRRRTVLQRNSMACKLYSEQTDIDERHRHRYEVNIERVPTLEAAGLKYVGRDETGERMEVLELDGHPFFLGCQYHPEFLSRPGRPSPPFLGLLLAASGQLGDFLGGGESSEQFILADPWA